MVTKKISLSLDDIEKRVQSLQEAPENIEPTPEKVEIKGSVCGTSIQGHTTREKKEREDRMLTKTFKFHGGEIELEAKATAVLDGHRGKSAADYCTKHFTEMLKEELNRFNKKQLTRIGIFNALKITTTQLHYGLLSQDKPILESGTTLSGSVLINDQLWSLNVGDSRVLLIDITKPEKIKIIPMTSDQNTQSMMRNDQEARVKYSTANWMKSHQESSLDELKKVLNDTNTIPLSAKSDIQGGGKSIEKYLKKLRNMEEIDSSISRILYSKLDKKIWKKGGVHYLENSYTKRGSNIVYNHEPLLEGQLQCLRSIGDHHLIKYTPTSTLSQTPCYLNPRPKISVYQITKNFRGIVLHVSDGVTNVFTNNKNISEFFLAALKKEQRLQAAVAVLAEAPQTNPLKHKKRRYNDDATAIAYVIQRGQYTKSQECFPINDAEAITLPLSFPAITMEYFPIDDAEAIAISNP